LTARTRLQKPTNNKLAKTEKSPLGTWTRHHPKATHLIPPAINKKAPDFSDAFLVEYLEKSSPLIIEAIRRWCDLLWDDWLEYQYPNKH
jgi:hypothetical protein